MRGAERKKLLLAHPRCIFCAGKRTAIEIDHVPPRLMFPNKDRPKGMEFPSCAKCNRGSRKCEALASLAAQIRLGNGSPMQLDWFERVLRHISHNFPDFLRMLQATTAQLRSAERLGSGFGAMDLRNPEVFSRLLEFGAKCGMALHWSEKGTMLPKDGKVVVLAFSNDQALNGEIPQDLIRLIPEARTLSQGRKNSIGTFEYNSVGTIDGASTAHWINLGEAIQYQIFAGTDLNVGQVEEEHVFEPGHFGN